MTVAPSPRATARTSDKPLPVAVHRIVTGSTIGMEGK
jgi:hypothetical protein